MNDVLFIKTVHEGDLRAKEYTDENHAYAVTLPLKIISHGPPMGH